MTDCKIKPLGDRIVIKKVAEKETTEAGIILPKNMQDDNVSHVATVVAVGDVDKVKVGDQVVFGRYGGTEIQIEDEKLIVIPIIDILAVFN